MYHWTDVPMILVGKIFAYPRVSSINLHLLNVLIRGILVPSREVLPRNQIKGKRKPGVKLEISKLKYACGDQLAPFEGLWGYTQGFDNYPGTIFRFPLRTAELCQSILRTSKRNLSDSEVSGSWILTLTKLAYLYYS
jgi:sacsin